MKKKSDIFHEYFLWSSGFQYDVKKNQIFSWSSEKFMESFEELLIRIFKFNMKSIKSQEVWLIESFIFENWYHQRSWLMSSLLKIVKSFDSDRCKKKDII